MEDVTTEVLQIIVQARNEATAQLNEVAGQLDGMAGHADGVRRAMAGIGAGAALGIAEAVKQAADFSNALTIAQNNTTMTAADVGVMRAAVLQLASESDAPIGQLIDGFRHISNFGFSAADATKILRAAMESAASTGANTADVANALANAMHEFGIAGADAGHAMDVLHLAAAQGNMTLEQFVDGAGKALGMAANLRVPLDQVAAALSALTRHGESVQVASTNISGMLSKIVNPAAAATKELAALSQKTGIDLVYDFSAAGLASKGLTGVLADLMKATDGNASTIFKLIPAMRGGQAAMILTGTGAKDFHTILGSLTDTMAGRTTPTLDAFRRSGQQLAFQLGELKNNVQVAAIAIGSVLLPELGRVAGIVLPIVRSFTDWVQTHAKLSAAILAAVAVIGLLAGGLGALGVTIFAISPALGLLAPLVAGMAAPVALVGAAVAALALAWRSDWGGIREATASAWNQIRPVFDALHGAYDALVAAFRAGGLSAAVAAIPSSLAPVGTAVLALGRQIVSAIAGIDWAALLAMVRRQAMAWGEALVAWVQPRVAPLLAEFRALAGQLLGAIGNEVAPLRAQLGMWASEFAAWIGPAVVQFLKDWPRMLDSLLSNVDKALPGLLASLGKWGDQFARWVGPAIPPMLKALAGAAAAIVVFLLETGPVLIKHLAIWGYELAAWVAPAIPHLLSAIGHLMDELVAWLHSTGVPQLQQGAGQLGNAFWSWVADVWPRLQTALQGVLHLIVDWVEHQMAPAVADAARHVGTSIVQGTKDGITSLAGGVKDHVTGFFGGLVDAGKAAVGAHSPSVKFYEVGQDMILGAEQGVLAEGPRLVAAVQTVFTNALAAARKLVAGGAIALSVTAGATGATAGSTSLTTTPAQLAAVNSQINTVVSGMTKTAALAAALVDHQQRLGQIQSQTVGTAAEYWAKQHDLAAENARYSDQRHAIEAAYAAQAKAERQAAQQQALADQANYARAIAQANTTEMAGLSGVAAARAKAHNDEVAHTAQLAAIKAQDYGNDHKYWTDRAAADSAYIRQHAADMAAITAAEKAARAETLAAHKAAHAAAMAAQHEATQDNLEGIARVKAAAAASYTSQTKDLTGLDALRAKSHADQLRYEADLAALAAKDYGDKTRYANDLARLETTHQRQQVADAEAIRALQASIHAEHVAQLNAIKKQRAQAHAEHLAQIAAEKAARTEAHTEHMRQIAAARAATKEAHDDHMAQMAAARAQRAANHAEAMRDLADERAQKAIAHAEETAAIKAAAQATKDMAAAAKGITSGASASTGYGTSGTPGVQAQTLLNNMAGLLSGQVGGVSLPGTISGDQKQLQDVLRNTAAATVSVVQNLAKATDLQGLQQTYDQQHNAYLNLEQQARMANNKDLLAQIQGQDHALTLDYARDKLAIAAVDHAKALADAAQKTLSTEQARLTTLQQQAVAAGQALDTARQNLDTVRQTLADTQYTVGQSRALLALRVPYEQQHLALVDKINAAQASGNTALASALTSQDTQLTSTYQAQLSHLQEVQQLQNDLQQQTLDTQKLQAAQDAVAKAQQAVAIDQQKKDRADAAVSAAQTQVAQDTKAANTAKVVWQAAIAAKAAADASAYRDAVRNQATLNQFIKQSYDDQAAQVLRLMGLYDQAHTKQMANIAAEGAARAASLGATAGGAASAANTGAASAAANNPITPTATPGAVQPGASLATSLQIAATYDAAAVRQYGSMIATLIAAGLAQGLGNTAAAQQALYQLNDGLHGQLVDYWKIKSPSGLTYQHGLDIAQGLANGLMAGAPRVAHAMADLYAPTGTGTGPVGAALPIPGASAGTSNVHIVVNVQQGAVQVSGGQGSGVDANAVGKVVADALDKMFKTQRTTSPGAGTLLPGVIIPVPKV